MNIEELLKSLNIENLDESQQNSIKEKVNDIIDVKARERADSLLAEEKEQLVEDFEEKFEDYKSDVTSKFSNFVDTVFEEELHVPEKVVQYARKGELYTDLIEQFKIRLALDEGILDDEVKDLLKDAKKEIKSLREQLNAAISGKLEVENDARKMASALYLREKCEGLTEEQRKRVLAILSDVYSKEEIDKKFDIVVNGILHEQEEEEKEEEEEEEGEKTKCYCEKCDKTVEVEGSCSDAKCPECGGKLTTRKKEESIKGKGKSEIEDGSEEINESDSPFDKDKKRWVKILKGA